MRHRFRTIPKTDPAQRGYGPQHRRERERRRALHHPSDPCCLCGQPLGPWGPGIHLDHHPTTKAYRGLAHRTCNVVDGARRGQQRAHRNANWTNPRW